MNVVFFSSYLNHHQLPFALAMDRLTDHQFTYVASRQISQARLDLGYRDMDREYPFVLRAYESPEAYARAMSLAENCDVLVVGVAKEEVVARKRKPGSVSFKYSERIYKKKTTRANFKERFQFAKYTFVTCRRHPHYMLCSSAYTASDYGAFGNYWGRTFKWGYFPEVITYDVETLLEKKRRNPRPQLLWVARFLALKHPEQVVELARDLRRRGYVFDLNMIGIGEELPAAQERIRLYGLEDFVHLLGQFSPQEVRAYMERADIFLFTSDRNEGWGAVLNESMNSACAVVASRAIGSVPFLIQNRRSGLIYRDGSQRALNRAVRSLLDDREKRERLGRNAYETMASTWNAEQAARRLLQLSGALMAGKRSPFRSGPCSKAHIIGKSR